MHAIICREPGDPEVLRYEEVPDPVAAADEVVLEVAAAGVNRADLLQRRGLYPPPPGASPILGLECSGTVAESDAAVWPVGAQACALLSGGGYATRVPVPVGQLLPVPRGIDLVAAAALPEVACTVYLNLAMVAALQPGEWVLIHGGGGGIGTFAIQWARAVGAHVAVTAGSPEKLRRCADLGAEVLIDYRSQDFAEEVRAATDGRGMDVILDVMGAKYLDRNVRALARQGRLVVIGLQGGVAGELDLGRLLTKQGSLFATSLRGRTVAEKSEIVAGVRDAVWPLIEAGQIVPVVDRVLPMADAKTAHRVMADSSHVGKILLQA